MASPFGLLFSYRYEWGHVKPMSPERDEWYGNELHNQMMGVSSNKWQTKKLVKVTYYITYSERALVPPFVNLLHLDQYKYLIQIYQYNITLNEITILKNLLLQKQI